MAEHRYPFAPLEEIARQRIRNTDEYGVGPGVPRLARLLGVHARQVHRWRELGVTRDQADQLADAVGHHPSNIWPEIFEHDIAAMERVCASPTCGERFIPDDPRQKKCSRRCVLRDAGARYKARHRDVVLERARASAARYYAENGDYVRSRRKRAYYETRDRQQDEAA
jgi:hypothetical protein